MDHLWLNFYFFFIYSFIFSGPVFFFYLFFLIQRVSVCFSRRDPVQFFTHFSYETAGKHRTVPVVFRGASALAIFAQFLQNLSR